MYVWPLRTSYAGTSISVWHLIFISPTATGCLELQSVFYGRIKQSNHQCQHCSVTSHLPTSFSLSSGFCGCQGSELVSETREVFLYSCGNISWGSVSINLQKIVADKICEAIMHCILYPHSTERGGGGLPHTSQLVRLASTLGTVYCILLYIYTVTVLQIFIFIHQNSIRFSLEYIAVFQSPVYTI